MHIPNTGMPNLLHSWSSCSVFCNWYSQQHVCASGVQRHTFWLAC